MSAEYTPDVWESLDTTLRYTRSVRFEDSLKFYQTLDLEANVKASPVDNLWVRVK